jgi:uncharacterized membrane protein
MFQFKNGTARTVYLAFAYFDQSENMFMSEGWWRIEPGSTMTPYTKPLDNQYYYYYAHSGDKLEWSGDTKLNVSHVAFKLKEPSHCIQSHDTRQFKLMDVGNSKSFLVHLTDSSSSPLSEEDAKLIKMFRGAFKK